MAKIYGEGQKILGVGAKDYHINENQWKYNLTKTINYNSTLGKTNQYFDKTKKKCYVKTQEMLNDELKQKQAEIKYENQLKIKKQEDIETIKASL